MNTNETTKFNDIDDFKRRQELKDIIDINEREKRIFHITKNIRCLDCTNVNATLELSDSPVAKEIRLIITKLMRKEYNDIDIYRQIAYIYGKHSIVRLTTTDESSIRHPIELFNFIAPFTIGILGAIYLRRKIKLGKRK